MAKILVIDDEPMILDLVTYFLTEAGHQVTPAMHSGKGLQVFRTLRPSLVITDILMPDRGGLDVIITLRLIEPGVPIIAISSSSRYLAYAKQLAASATVQKPIDYPLLVQTVAEVLARQIDRPGVEGGRGVPSREASPAPVSYRQHPPGLAPTGVRVRPDVLPGRAPFDVTRA